MRGASRVASSAMDDIASAAVEAALGAGARYADARAMTTRTESMAARNGVVEALDRTDRAGVGVRALAEGSWGFFAVPDLSPAAARRAGERAAEIARASALAPGPALRLAPGPTSRASWSNHVEEDPWGVPVEEKAALLESLTRTMLENGADVAEADSEIWDTAKWLVTSEGTHVDQRIVECGAVITATAVGEGETQRRSYPGVRGQYGTRGWELVRPLDLPTNAALVGIPAGGSVRGDGFNRIPMVRMTNVGLLPGSSSLEEMIAATDHGILMDTNRSWSIDDKRLNFQFGCEIGWEIRNGRRGRMLRNPTYTGIGPRFWAGLDMLGGRDEWAFWGTPNCGKGQP